MSGGAGRGWADGAGQPRFRRYPEADVTRGRWLGSREGAVGAGGAAMESREPLRELGGALRAVLARLRGGGRGRAGAGPGPADSPLAEVSLCRYRGRTGRGPRAVRAAALLGRTRYGTGRGGAGRGRAGSGRALAPGGADRAVAEAGVRRAGAWQGSGLQARSPAGLHPLALPSGVVALAEQQPGSNSCRDSIF